MNRKVTPKLLVFSVFVLLLLSMAYVVAELDLTYNIEDQDATPVDSGPSKESEKATEGEKTGISDIEDYYNSVIPDAGPLYDMYLIAKEDNAPLTKPSATPKTPKSPTSPETPITPTPAPQIQEPTEPLPVPPAPGDSEGTKSKCYVSIGEDGKYEVSYNKAIKETALKDFNKECKTICESRCKECKPSYQTKGPNDERTLAEFCEQHMTTGEGGTLYSNYCTPKNCNPSTGQYKVDDVDCLKRLRKDAKFADLNSYIKYLKEKNTHYSVLDRFEDLKTMCDNLDRGGISYFGCSVNDGYSTCKMLLKNLDGSNLFSFDVLDVNVISEQGLLKVEARNAKDLPVLGTFLTVINPEVVRTFRILNGMLGIEMPPFGQASSLMFKDKLNNLFGFSGEGRVDGKAILVFDPVHAPTKGTFWIADKVYISLLPASETKAYTFILNNPSYLENVYYSFEKNFHSLCTYESGKKPHCTEHKPSPGPTPGPGPSPKPRALFSKLLSLGLPLAIGVGAVLLPMLFKEDKEEEQSFSQPTTSGTYVPPKTSTTSQGSVAVAKGSNLLIEEAKTTNIEAECPEGVCVTSFAYKCGAYILVQKPSTATGYHTGSTLEEQCICEDAKISAKGATFTGSGGKTSDAEAVVTDTSCVSCATIKEEGKYRFCFYQDPAKPQVFKKRLVYFRNTAS